MHKLLVLGVSAALTALLLVGFASSGSANAASCSSADGQDASLIDDSCFTSSTGVASAAAAAAETASAAAAASASGDGEALAFAQSYGGFCSSGPPV